MEIPAGVFSQSYDPMVEIDPVSFPIAGDPSVLSDATQKLIDQFGPDANGPTFIYEVRILLSDGTLFSGGLSKPGASSLVFTSRIDGGKIGLYELDEMNRVWTEEAATWTPPSVSFPLNKGGIMAIFQFQPLEGTTGVDVAYAYPVPWRPHSNNPALYGTSQDGITFAGVPPASSGSIVSRRTCSGHLYSIRVAKTSVGRQDRVRQRCGEPRSYLVGPIVRCNHKKIGVDDHPVEKMRDTKKYRRCLHHDRLSVLGRRIFVRRLSENFLPRPIARARRPVTANKRCRSAFLRRRPGGCRRVDQWNADDPGRQRLVSRLLTPAGVDWETTPYL